MAKIAIDLIGETAEEVEVTCFTFPAPGVCFTIRTGTNIIEIDLPEKLFAEMVEKMGKSHPPLDPVLKKLDNIP